MTRCPRCQRRLPPSGDCPTHGRATGFIAEVALPEPPIAPPRGWRLDRHLATGGTAHVFLVGRDDGTQAILKWGRWRERDIQVRFELEARVLRTVGAAWTPALHEHGVLDGWPYIIMEYLAGETLAAWMSRNGERGGLGEILGLLDQIAAGLAAIHGAGVIHRDLKPENVVIGPRGVRLIDFGLAKQPVGLGLTQVGAVVGTVHYLAPEQAGAGAAVDHRADIYSFGVVAYEMLCGGPPFIGERRSIEYQHSVCRPPSVREWRAVPDELEQLISACLAKQREARPQSAGEIRAQLARALDGAATARGVAPRPLGVRGRVALLWADGADPVAVVRAVGDVNGVVVRQRGDAMLAAFTGLDHDAPLAAALTAARALSEGRARVVVHVGTALLRRSAHGKISAYGNDIERCERWLPGAPVPAAAGVLLTQAAAELAPEAIAAGDAPGFFRLRQRDRTDAADARTTPALVGRGNLIESLAAIATQALVDARPVHVAITGDSGAGKTRVLEAIVEQLRTAGNEVIAVRGKKRFPGERQGDALLAALGSDAQGGPLASALGRAARRGVVIAIDDAASLPAATYRAIDGVLARGNVKLAVLTASQTAIGDLEASHRIGVSLPPLGFEDAAVLVRELLQPARLIPGVLVERLAIRAGGNPGLLVALTGEITRRGAVRRHVGSDEWYVAADELDTMLAAPSPGWFAVRAVEDLPADVVSIVRTCAGLGPRFSADEIAAVRDSPDPASRLAWLVQDGVLTVEDGWYRFSDPGVQDALYNHVLDERGRIHSDAFRYWLGCPGVDAIDRLARLAYHGAGAREAINAATCYVALAGAARERGDDDDAEDLLGRALACAANVAPRLQATTLIARARLRHARRRFDDAAGDARTARRLGEHAGDVDLQLDALVIEALASAAADRLDLATAACAAASAIATVDISIAARTRVLGAIGVVRARAGQRDEAVAMLQLAASLAEATGDRETASEAARALAQIAGDR